MNFDLEETNFRPISGSERVAWIAAMFAFALMLGLVFGTSIRTSLKVDELSKQVRLSKELQAWEERRADSKQSVIDDLMRQIKEQETTISGLQSEIKSMTDSLSDANSQEWQTVPQRPEFAEQVPSDNLIEQAEAGQDEVASGLKIAGALPPRDEWLGKFRTARKHALTKHPNCEACGCTDSQCGPMNAHHVISVKRIEEEHLEPSLKWDEENLIILCRKCHLEIGHDPDGPNGPLHPSWSTSNPNVRRDAAKRLKSIQASKTTLAP